MVFRYKAITPEGQKKEGTIDSVSKDLAITALQRRGLVVLSIREEGIKQALNVSLFENVPLKTVVISSRQISILFDAQVSALKAFTLLATNVENRLLSRKLLQVVSDLQAGFSISGALAKHPDVFSNFYVSMVRAGEESGKLNQTFNYLADYLERQFELTSKTKNALIYPAFVVFVFVFVMALMMVLVIPKLSQLILESGQDIPIYTKIVIATSNFFVNYGIFMLIFVVGLALYGWRLSKSKSGKAYLDNLKLSIPLFGNLFKKLYVSRIADNMETMLTSGISIVRAIEITSQVVGNRAYGKILEESVELVKGGASFSDSLAKHELIPNIMIQMVKVGEETGSLGTILKTLARFYRKEVDGEVDSLVGLIEPLMIVLLGVGVGVLVSSVLVPIYNIASSIQ